MPQINRVRVNNINYNDGTQRYDDFLMNFSCRNALYDLVNGGGKSILLMLIMQTVLPNQELDKKQPVSKLFKSSNNNNTIHSMVEWKLDKEARERFRAKYLLTGFCAKKGTEGKGEVEYFNYMITYNEFNDYDIRNFELSDGKEKVNFTTLRKKLRNMQDGALIDCHVELFETNESYKRRLSEFGIYESHWNIVRGINESEGHVRTYIEKNYKSSRQLIDKLLINEIIEKANAMKLENSNEENELADSLIDIQDKLLELSQKKKDKDRYESQVDCIGGFIEKLQDYEAGLNENIALVDSYKNSYIHIEQNSNYVKEQYDEVSHKISDKKEEELYEKKYLALLKIEKIKKSLLKSEEELLELNNEYRRAESNYNNAVEEARFAEGKNSFIKYKEAYTNLRTIENEIKHKQESTSDKLAIISKLIAFKKVSDTAKLNKLNNQIDNNSKQLIDLRDTIADNEAKTELLNQEAGSNAAFISMTKSNLEAYRNNLKELNEKIDSVLTELDEEKVIIKDDERRDRYQNDIEAYDIKIEHISDRIVEIENEKKVLTNDILKYETDMSYKKQQCETTKERIDDYDDKYGHIAKIKGLLKLDEQVSTESMINYLEATLNDEHKNFYDCKSDCKNLSARIEALSSGRIGIDNEEIQSVYSFLSKAGGSVALGSEFIKDRTKQEKEDILERLPILPYSVVVDETVYAKIGKTIKLDSLYLDTIVPVICSKAIREGVCCNNENITYLHNDIKLFINPEYLGMELDKFSLELHKKEKELTNHEENIKIYQQYYAELCTFRDSYENNIDEWKKSYEQTKSIIVQIEAQIISLKEKTVKLDEEKSIRVDEQTAVLNKKEMTSKAVLMLDDRIEISNNIDESEEGLSKMVKQAEGNNRRIILIKEESAQIGRKIKTIESENIELASRKDEISRTWNERYVNYDNDAETSEDECSYSDDELTSELNGAIDAYEKENADVKGNMKACEAYRASMSEYESQLKKNRYSAEHFYDYEKTNGEIICTQDELKAKESNRDEALKNMNTCQNNMNAKDKEAQLIRGELKNSNETYDRDFCSNEYDKAHNEVVVTDEDKNNLDSAIRNHKNKYNMISGEVKAMYINENNLRAENDELVRIISNQQEYAEAMKIELEHTTDVAKQHMDIASIRSMIDDVKKKLKSNSERCMKLRSKSKASKERCVKEIEPLNPDYAYQIERLDIPENTEELSAQIGDYKKSRDYLVEEIHMIDKSLEEIIEIKNKFNKKCIQKSLSIKADIDKFGKYSRMIIDGEEVQAVKLRIHYFPDDIQVSKMERYIDRIVDDTSKYSNDEEKKKVLRDKLSGKSLFGVIVNDAAGIEFSLYKRERIKENSRHLKYEEAVGSTGQSQGIYILLIIAIVNYISKMYSNEMDENSITKTIFIDNPFGAAKDVYIWEPILSMLRDNNVQLIIPTRGVAPAMTSKFDIYYTLGQKMSGSKMQTVVVNYESNVENENIEYVKTESEQLDMFSMLEAAGQL